MTRISILFIISTLFTTTFPVTCMEQPAKSDWQCLFKLPYPEEKALLLNIAAYCQAKDSLRKTCRYLNKLASRKNEELLAHSWLRLSEEAFHQFAFYHTALGNSKIVFNLLNKGAHPDACDNKGLSLMHYAAGCGYLDIVDAFLKHSDLCKELVIAGTNSPLYLAIKHDHDRVVQHILSACESECGIATLKKRGHYAVKNKAVKVLKVLTEKLGTIPEQTERAKEFLTAATDTEQKVLNQIHLTIQSGDAFKKRKLDNHILYYSNIGNTELVRTFLAQNITTEENGTPCTKKVDGGQLLCAAARKGHLNVVRTLLDCNIDPNSVDKAGESALINTVISGEITHLPIIKLLISKGAIVDKPIEDYYYAEALIGSTPLILAATYGVTSATQLLIDSGADVTIKTKTLVTPLHAAVLENCTSIIEMLINKGADVNAQDETKQTPLHCAIHHSDALLILLACPDINVNVQDDDGNTPLHLAILARDFAMTIELLEHLSISVNVQNNDKKTALDLACEHKKYKNQKFENLLIEHGAKTHNQLMIKSMKKPIKENCTIQ